MTNPTQTTATIKIRGARTGLVTAKSGRQTVRVEISNLVKHPRYGKYVRRRTRLAVHDPRNAAGPGDVVEVAPCRRISKTKSWRLVRVVRRGALSGAPEPAGE